MRPATTTACHRWHCGGSLVCGIAATLAANLAAGIGHGMPGVEIAAWPAAALVFSYELLLWLVRASAGQRGPACATQAGQ